MLKLQTFKLLIFSVNVWSMHLFLQGVIQTWCTMQYTLLIGSAASMICQSNEVRGQGYDKINNLQRKIPTEIQRNGTNVSWILSTSLEKNINVNRLSVATQMLLSAKIWDTVCRMQQRKLQQEWKKSLTRSKKKKKNENCHASLFVKSEWKNG